MLLLIRADEVIDLDLPMAVIDAVDGSSTGT
jgi:hypothetical protein